MTKQPTKGWGGQLDGAKENLSTTSSYLSNQVTHYVREEKLLDTTADEVTQPITHKIAGGISVL